MSSIENFVWKTLSAPRQWIAPWYSSYALLGALSSGLIPVLIPLMMVAISNKLSTVGYVMGAFNLGSMASPLWGLLADARKLYRPIYFGGFFFLMAAIAVFPLAHGLAMWLPLALVAGAASAAVSTCATLFIVEFTPHREWTPRIGWLQTFNGTGQVAGLLLAGVFAATNIPLGLWIGAGLMIPAMVIGRFGLPTKAQALPTDKGSASPHLNFVQLARFSRIELLSGGLLRYFHLINMAGLKNLGKLLPTRFGRFMLACFCLFFGVSGLFAYFPIFLHDSFAVAPAATSLAYAIAAGIGLVFYTLGGRLAQRFGPTAIFSIGLLLRLLGFGAMVALVFIKPGSFSAVLALLSFGVIVLAWPILSVTATELTSELTPITQGAAQGLYNSTNAIATVLGTNVGGLLVHFFGYKSIPVMGATGVLLALIISRGLTVKSEKKK